MKIQASIARTTCTKPMTGRLTTAFATKLLPLLLLLILPATVQAQFNYTTTNGTITITGYTGSGGAVTIPDRIPDTTNGLPVTSIGGYYYTSFTINGPVTVFAGAFQGSSLTSVTIPDSVSSIGDYAFSSCGSLTSITIGTNVTNIGGFAFWECYSLTNLTIPNSVTSIGDSAFQQCMGLTSITIGTNVTSIGDEAFLFCYSLPAITVDTNNPAYSSVAGVLFNKSQITLIQYPAGKAGAYTIPSSVTSIGDSAFANSGLTSVTIPNGVTSIGKGAFYACASLTGVTIPNSVTSIGDGAFYETLLTSVTIPNSVTNVGGSVFFNSEV